MLRSFVIILVLSQVVSFCNCDNARQQRNLLKIRIVDHEDEDPKVSATVVNNPAGVKGVKDKVAKRRAFNVPNYREGYPESLAAIPISQDYLRRPIYHGNTVYSQNELTQSLGTLVNSILMSRVKYPVNKIYIFGQNSADIPYPTKKNPIYQVYEENEADDLIESSRELKGDNANIGPTIRPEYYPTSTFYESSASPIYDNYHPIRVPEPDLGPQILSNYQQDARNLYKARYQAISRKKPINERAKAYTDFMKSREYFLPRLEPDHHTEHPTSPYIIQNNKPRRQPLHYEPEQIPPIKFTRKEPALNAFTTQSIEFTPNDAIRKYPGPTVSDSDDNQLHGYTSDTSNYNYNQNIVDSESNSDFKEEDEIRLLESTRYTVPRDCTTRCLEQNNKNYDPVCGSDGRTYLNENMLNCLSACKNSGLEMDYQGPCN